MALSAWPDLWGLAQPQRDPSDLRATLLRLHAELFVEAPVRDAETVRSFEALALGFLPLVGAETLQTIARLAAPCVDTPASILTYLVHRSTETRDAVVRLAPRLPAQAVDLLLGTADGRLALAHRPDLDRRPIELLLVMGDNAIEDALAANPSLAAADAAFVELIHRAQLRPSLARILLMRPDLTLADRCSLYLAADPDTRSRIREQMAASPLVQPPPLLSRLTGRTEELLALAEAGDVRGVEGWLTGTLGLPSSTRWSILEAERHDILALALRVLGVAEEDAVRVFLTLHPALAHSVATVFGLVRTFRTTLRPIALALVEAILGTRVVLDRSGQHQPAMDPASLPARFLVQERSRPATDRQRQAG